MSNHVPGPERTLPERPDLRHLKDQAKDLLKSGAASSLTSAQLHIARLYGFPSWPKLKAHVESLRDIGALKQAIDTNDVDRVKTILTRHPELHRAPLGYAQDGPLTWVAECRVPWEPPGPARLALAQWMLENGSDVHQGGDGPLMRAALNGVRIPMMELLVRHGADVNALWHGYFPILFAPCESLDPASLQWLLDHGADPNRRPKQDTALDYLLGTYVRSPQRLSASIDLLLNAGAATRFDVPAVLELLRGRLDNLAKLLVSAPDLVHTQFPQLGFGASGGRLLTLQGATLLHVAAEFGGLEAALLLLDHGADVNAAATVDASGVGGQTPIFHAVSQSGDFGFALARLLLDRGARLSVRVKLPGHYERPEEIVECTPLGYALRFPGTPGTVMLLRERGAVE